MQKLLFDFAEALFATREIGRHRPSLAVFRANGILPVIRSSQGMAWVYACETFGREHLGSKPLGWRLTVGPFPKPVPSLIPSLHVHASAFSRFELTHRRTSAAICGRQAPPFHICDNEEVITYMIPLLFDIT
jgi:hypothetical protein